MGSNNGLIGFDGWCFFVKNMKVKWDDCSQLNGTMKNVPNHQPDMVLFEIRMLYSYIHRVLSYAKCRHLWTHILIYIYFFSYLYIYIYTYTCMYVCHLN